MMPNGDRLYQYLSKPKVRFDPDRPAPPKKHYYCALCKVAFQRATTKSPVIHTKSCRCSAICFGSGDEAERKAVSMSQAYSAMQRFQRSSR